MFKPHRFNRWTRIDVSYLLENELIELITILTMSGQEMNVTTSCIFNSKKKFSYLWFDGKWCISENEPLKNKTFTSIETIIKKINKKDNIVDLFRNTRANKWHLEDVIKYLNYFNEDDLKYISIRTNLNISKK